MELTKPKMEILVDGEVSQVATESMVGELQTLAWSSSLEDGPAPKRPKTGYAPSLIQTLKVLGPHRQPELLMPMPKVGDYPIQAKPVSYQVPPPQVPLIQPLKVLGPHPEMLKPKIEMYTRQALPASNQVPSFRTSEIVGGRHGFAMPDSSLHPIQTSQFTKPIVESYHGAIVPFEPEPERSKPMTEGCAPRLIDTLRWKESMNMAPTPMPSSTIATRLEPELTSISTKNFWKAGDYERRQVDPSTFSFTGMDHMRVHPMFLHSNATSHKWAIGALAELLDNAMDEIKHGATFVNIDILVNKKDGSKMLLVEDNGGGMDPNKLRQCMSLGFSVKRKSTDTIGQYGNGFKTSTMRLGADVIVFSRCSEKDGRSPPTQSIGLLSYTFLTKTGKEDIVVPIIDYKREGDASWNKLTRSSRVAWDRNLETIVQWSPYNSEDDLLQQFSSIRNQGTRVVIYNLWEDDQGDLELDFDTDYTDIQVRGAKRDEKQIRMADQFPNSRHFLTYTHSLRSYASILYLRIPQGFGMILRGREIEHHNIVDDMILKKDVTYKSNSDPKAFASVSIGFVKDAKEHMDIQGFNVYHKNRLIKPFWRVWNVAGSGGRGVIGVLEANFVEPAHDKQGFERTTLLFRLETWLKELQKRYWRENSETIGYAAPIHQKKLFIDNGVVIGPTSSGSAGSTSCNKSQLEMASVTNDVHRLNNGNSVLSYHSLKNQNSISKYMGESFVRELKLEKEKNKVLGEQLEEAKRKMDSTNKELQHSIYMLAEERRQNSTLKEILEKKLNAANLTIHMLLEKMSPKLKANIKQEH